MEWLTKLLLTIENYKRRKSVQRRITECEKQINRVFKKLWLDTWDYEHIDALKLRIIELQRDLIELEYKEPVKFSKESTLKP